MHGCTISQMFPGGVAEAVPDTSYKGVTAEELQFGSECLRIQGRAHP